MPFTPTHIAAALPIAWLSRWRLPFSALVFGTIVPDLAGYYPALLDYGTTHSLPGIVTHCTPIGVFLYYTYQGILKRPFFDLCPTAMTSRMRTWIDHPIQWRPLSIVTVFCCVMFGALTHVFWDSFTHFSGWGVANFPVLNDRLSLTIAGRPVRWFTVVQHGSSLLLIPMLLGFAVWLRKLPPQIDPVERARVPHGIVTFVLIAIVIGAMVYFQHYQATHPRTNWLSALAISTKRSGAVAFALFLVYALGMNFLWWRERSRAPHVAGDPSQPI